MMVNSELAEFMDSRQVTLKSLALADAFGWALTGFEVWRYAPDVVALKDVLVELDALTLDGVLVESDGHYVFSGRKELIEERLLRSHLIETKRRRARRWARFMARLPYVLGVFAYGSLATGHTGEDSDLDVYVVLKDGRIFMGRLLISIFLETFGVRRSGTKIKNQVCLNHFVIDSVLEFPKEYRSQFSAWLWARMYPLAVADETLPGRFYEANRWVMEFFPNMERKKKGERRAEKREPRRRGVMAMDGIEKWLGKVQLKRIANHPKTKEGKGRIVANERELIFHPSLPEDEVMSRLSMRLKLLDIQD